MNKIFKVIWSKTKGCYIVVSEIAKNQSKSGKIRARDLALAAIVGVGVAMSTGVGVVHAEDPLEVRVERIENTIQDWKNNGAPGVGGSGSSSSEVTKAYVDEHDQANATAAANAQTAADNAQKDATKALSDAANAQTTANSAKDLADNKRRVFFNDPKDPDTTKRAPKPPYDEGDLWVQGINGDILVCQTEKTKDQTYSASDWTTASKYTDDSLVKSSAIGTVDVEYALSNSVTTEPAESDWKTTAPE
mgnify:CR=1 FL=1